jgi:hypothetical protein
MRRAVVVISLLGCGSSSNSQPPPPAVARDAAATPVSHGEQYTPEQTIHLDQPKLDLPKQEPVKLVEPGTGDRAPLVYVFATATTETTMETKLETRHLDGGTWTPKLALPPIDDGFATTIDGTRVVLRGLPGTIAGTSTPEAEQYLASWRALLQGRRATVAVDARGQLGKIAFTDDPGNQRSEPSREQLAERLLVTIVPVPAEPVGIGASWKVVTVLRQGPASVKQTATYTLSARTPDRWTIHIKLQRLGQDQAVVDPSLPKGSTVDLVALFRTLEGTVEIDPKRPLIAKGSLTIESRVHAKITVPDRPAVEQILEDTGTVTIR